MTIKDFLLRKKETRFFLWAFLIFYLAFIFATFRDYGYTCDENGWYVRGGGLLKHFLNMEKGDAGKFHTIEQESYCYLYPALLRIFSHRIVPERLHLLNLLFAAFGFIAVFELLFTAYRNSFWAAMGPVCLFFTLRFSGDIPGNPKDAPFAVAYLCTLAAVYFFRKRWNNQTLETLIIGSLIGISSCMRIIGLTLLPVWLFSRFYEYYFAEENTRYRKPSILIWARKECSTLILVFLVSQAWMMAFWPFLGGNYFGSYPTIIKAAKQFPWDSPILFMGKAVQSSQLPWTYLPVWLLVTMPVALILFFLFSWFLAKRMEKAPKQLYVLFAFTFVLQAILYLAFKPVIYNGLRHYLFLVPIFCAMAVMGFIEFIKGGLQPIWKKAVLVLCLMNFVSITCQLVNLYPYQYIYFNELVGGLKGADGKFEKDYWGAGLKEASLWLSDHVASEPNKKYKVKTCLSSEQQTYYFKSNMQGELRMKDADYQIEENNQIALAREGLSAEDIRTKTIYTVSREGVPLFYVLKLK